MEENTKVSEAISEIKDADEESLEKVIEDWFGRTRTDGMKIGAYFVSAAVAGAIDKNLKDGMNSSRRDLERAIKRVMEIVSVQLKQEETLQNDLQNEEVSEEVTND